MLLQIGVDSASGLHSPGVGGNCPGTTFIFPNSEKGNHAQQVVGRADQTDQATFLQAVAGEEFGGVGIVHLRQFCLYFPTNSGNRGIRTRSNFRELVHGSGIGQGIA